MIQLVRVSGVALVLVGILVQARRFELLPQVPPGAGYVLILVGLAAAFLAPLALARRWRSR